MEKQKCPRSWKTQPPKGTCRSLLSGADCFPSRTNTDFSSSMCGHFLWMKLNVLGEIKTKPDETSIQGKESSVKPGGRPARMISELRGSGAKGGKTSPQLVPVWSRNVRTALGTHRAPTTPLERNQQHHWSCGGCWGCLEVCGLDSCGGNVCWKKPGLWFVTQ